MATVYYKTFDVARVDAEGQLVPVPGITLDLYNVTAAASLGTAVVDNNSMVIQDGVTATAGDVIEFSHSTYPNTFRQVLTATQDEAYTLADNNAGTYIVENLVTGTVTAATADVYAEDLNDPTAKPFRLGTAEAAATTTIPYQTNITKNLRIRLVAKSTDGAQSVTDLAAAPYQDITVPATNNGSPISVGISAYATLDDALTAIGSSPGVVTFTEDLTISTDYVIPANALLEPRNGAQLVISGGTIQFEGPGIAGSPQRQIFSGFAAGDVKFTGDYPPVMYAEWWGAIADDSTDSIAAFRALHEAMQAPPVSPQDVNRFAGANVRLLGGYYISDTWEIQRPILLEGRSGDNWNTMAWIRVPAHKTGIRVHGRSTLTGVDDGTKTGQYAVLKKFGIFGASNAANNTVVSVNDLTFTITGGTISSIKGEDGFHDGLTIAYDGWTYLIAGSTVDQSTPDTVFDIRRPRVILTADGSDTVTVVGYAPWPAGGEWAGGEININGVLYTIVSNTNVSMVLSANVPTYTGDAEVTKLPAATDVPARFNIYHGIDLRGAVQIDGVQVRSFSGDGIHADSSAWLTAYPGGEPNMNGSHIHRASLYFNEGHGLYLHGTNSNIITVSNIDTTSNKGWGVYDHSFLGNTYIGNHASTNYYGSYRLGEAIGGSSGFGNYDEGGNPSNVFGQYTTWFGGQNGAGMMKAATGGSNAYQWESHGVLMGVVQGQWEVPGSAFRVRNYARLITSSSPHKQVMAQLGHQNQPLVMLAFGAADEAINIAVGNGTVARYGAYQLSYDGLAAGWYNLHHGGSVYTDQANSVMAFSGSEAAEGAFRLAFPNGFRTGITDPHVTRILTATASLNFDLTANATQDLTITVTGAAAGDVVSLGVPHGSVTADTLFFAWVSAADTVTVRAMRIAGTPDPASGTFRVMVTKF